MIMNGNVPTLISGVPKLARSEATIRSHASAMPERAGEHVPVGRAQRRLAELADQLEQADEALGAEVALHERRVGGEAAEVGARGERLLVRGREHDAARAVFVARALERRDQAAEHVRRQRVARVRVVERDRRHARLGELVEDHVGGHPRILTGTRARGK